MTEAQRYFLLTQTDALWKEHLQVTRERRFMQIQSSGLGFELAPLSPMFFMQAIKFLQQAVGLRGYAAKDPLTEFKLEGYNLFVEMTAQAGSREGQERGKIERGKRRVEGNVLPNA